MLIGKRVYLRRFRLEDAPILLKWGQDQRYHELAGFEHLANIEEAKKSAQQYSERKNSYALCLRAIDQVIGLVELYERGLDENSGLLQSKEIGFLLQKDFEGNGYMTEALTLIINDCFNNRDQLEIWAGTYPQNTQSQKLLDRLGFKYVYSADYSQLTNLFAYQEKYYLLKKEEWLKIVSNTKS